MTIGLPSTVAVVVILPRVLATTSVLPLALACGFWSGISMMSVLFLMVAFMALFSFYVVCGLCAELREANALDNALLSALA